MCRDKSRPHSVLYGHCHAGSHSDTIANMAKKKHGKAKATFTPEDSTTGGSSGKAANVGTNAESTLQQSRVDPEFEALRQNTFGSGRVDDETL